MVADAVTAIFGIKVFASISKRRNLVIVCLAKNLMNSKEN
jgi:hypothetical protein